MNGLRLSGGVIVIAAAMACAPVAAADWPQNIVNPKPLADDLVLPMPCGGSMVFRPVVVPVKNIIDDRRFPVGGLDGGQGYKENQRQDYISGTLAEQKNKSNRLYYIGKYTVTQLQFAAMQGQCPDPKGAAMRLPQTGVGWIDAVVFSDAYSKWLLANAADKLPSEAGQPAFIRLPTEAEWEFAARGGAKVTDGEFAAPLPPMTGPLESYAWFGGPNSSNNELQPIGLLEPNPLGLFDMLGNVGQIVFDLFRLNHLSRLHGEAGGFVVRGGNYLTPEADIRTAEREEFPPYAAQGPRRDRTVGFRVAISAPVLPTTQRINEIRSLWDHLPESSDAGGVAAKPESDPLKEVEALARSVDDVQIKTRLAALSAVIAGNIKTSNEQRDRAARSNLNLAVRLSTEIRDDTIILMGLQRAVAHGGASESTANIVKARTDKLRSIVLYYRDTLQSLISEYSDTLCLEQSGVLKQELEQRQPDQLPLLAFMLSDLAAYRKKGDLAPAVIEKEYNSEICKSGLGRDNKGVCAP